VPTVSNEDAVRGPKRRVGEGSRIAIEGSAQRREWKRGTTYLWWGCGVEAARVIARKSLVIGKLLRRAHD